MYRCQLFPAWPHQTVEHCLDGTLYDCQRRSKFMGYVRHQVASQSFIPGEVFSHDVERAGQFSDLVARFDVNPLREVSVSYAAGDKTKTPKRHSDLKSKSQTQ